MKIGILTFHSQLNYGGVLQCWALQTVLEKLGYEVVVLDRWMDEHNSTLEQGYCGANWRAWVKLLCCPLAGLGDFNKLKRVRRTKKFIRNHLNITNYHFIDWGNAPEELGVDILIVGSDQVWHCGDWGDPRVYLLEGAPNLPSIAYAASFGMVDIPEFIYSGRREIKAWPIYKRGIAKFRAVSCREEEGVRICRRLGFSASHVSDPTLLAWIDNQERKENNKVGLVCYFLGESLDSCLDALEEFASSNNCSVTVFLDNCGALPFPNNYSALKDNTHILVRRMRSRVNIAADAAPDDFINAFKKAKWVISDSFHALMFSICFGCNARILTPTSEKRNKMFSRLKEIAEHVNGPLIAESLKSALESFSSGEYVTYDYEWFRCQKRKSVDWLLSALS